MGGIKEKLFSMNIYKIKKCKIQEYINIVPNILNLFFFLLKLKQTDKIIVNI